MLRYSKAFTVLYTAASLPNMDMAWPKQTFRFREHQQFHPFCVNFVWPPPQRPLCLRKCKLHFIFFKKNPVPSHARTEKFPWISLLDVLICALNICFSPSDWLGVRKVVGGPADGWRLQCHRYQPGWTPYKVTTNYKQIRDGYWWKCHRYEPGWTPYKVTSNHEQNSDGYWWKCHWYEPNQKTGANIL